MGNLPRGSTRLSISDPVLSLQQAMDLPQQPFQINGLGVIIVATGFQGFLPVPGHGVGGEGNDGDGPGVRLGFEEPGGFPTVHHRQAHVHKDQVRGLGLRQINALLALRAESIGPHELAVKAIELEQAVLKETVGSQDQVAASYGGLNVIRFARDGIFTVAPLEIPQARVRELESHMMLVYMGTSRLASDVAARVTANLHNRAAALKEMRQMVDEGAAILRERSSLEAFGELLHEGWVLKQSLTEGVTTPPVDRLYERARAHGVIGGKLMGAGGTGFMLLFAPPERHQEVQEALPNYLWVPFAFERTESTIIYKDHELTGHGLSRPVND